MCSSFKIAEKGQYSYSYGKSASLGFTSYHAIDPIVLGITIEGEGKATRRDGTNSITPSSHFSLNPFVGFSVNDKISLTQGVQWSYQLPYKINGVKITQVYTTTELILGTSYGISKDSYLNFTFSTVSSGGSGAALSLNWQYTL